MIEKVKKFISKSKEVVLVILSTLLLVFSTNQTKKLFLGIDI